MKKQIITARGGPWCENHTRTNRHCSEDLSTNHGRAAEHVVEGMAVAALCCIQPRDHCWYFAMNLGCITNWGVTSYFEQLQQIFGSCQLACQIRLWVSSELICVLRHSIKEGC